MQSPPAEWVLFAAHFGVLDYLRNHGDADGDTFSECLRGWFRTDTTPGRIAFTAALTGAALVFHRHITKPHTRGA